MDGANMEENNFVHHSPAGDNEEQSKLPPNSHLTAVEPVVEQPKD
jgi:hypothetical protein